MTGFVITTFAGAVPRLSPRLLAESQAQNALNTDLLSGEMRSMCTPEFVVTPSKAGTKKTIYRFGQANPNDEQYWFHWTDDVDVARGLVVNDSLERTVWTGEAEPRVTDSSIALSPGTDYPIAWYKLGVPKPAAAPTATLAGAGSGDPRYRAYVYTYVTGWGEEGPPSDASNIVAWKTGNTVDLSGMSTGPGAGYNVTHKRIYRAISGSTGTDYQFVAQIAVASTTYNDSIADTALGEVIPSKLWLPPDAGLKGVVVVGASYLAAFLNNDVWLSEPFVPHAWPVRYRKSMPYGVVGLGTIDRGLVVLTNGEPYVGAGADPATLNLTKLAAGKACVAKRSIVSMPGGVAYACAEGLGFVTAAGFSMPSEFAFSRKEWQTLAPSSIFATRWGRKYMGFYQNGSVQQGFILEPANPQAGVIYTDIIATAAYNDPQRDTLYLQIGADIKRWVVADYAVQTRITEAGDRRVTEAGDVRVTSVNQAAFTWKSKVFSLPRPINPAVGQVIATAYPVTFKLYGDGELKHTQTVTGTDPFRMPAGYLARDFEVQIEASATSVRGVAIAESMQELRNLVT